MTIAKRIYNKAKYMQNVFCKMVMRKIRYSRFYPMFVLKRKPDISYDLLSVWLSEGGWLFDIHGKIVSDSYFDNISQKEYGVSAFGAFRPFPARGDDHYWQTDYIRSIHVSHEQCLLPAIVYRHSLQADPVVIWESSRLQHLGKSFCTCRKGSGALSDEDVNCLEHWYLNNPYPRGMVWEVPLEAALRSLSLLHILGCECPGDLRERTEQCLWFCIRLLLQTTLKGKTPPNNHLLAELVVLALVLPLYPKLLSKHYGKVCRLLNQQIGHQFHADGHNAECSSGYHVVSTEALLVLRFACNNCPAIRTLVDSHGLELPLLDEAALLGAKVCHSYITAFHRSPNFGDSSDSRFFPAADAPFRNCRDHSYVFDLADMETDIQGNLFEVYSKSGIGYYSNELYGVCAFAAVSGRISGHSHNDKCSWVLRHGDKDIFVDPGTWMYNSPESVRLQFRSSFNHNVLIVDNQEQSGRNLLHSFSRNDDTDSGIQALSNNSIEMWHGGYSRLEGVGVTKRVLSFGESCISVSDTVKGNGTHNLKMVYVLHPRVSVSVSEAPDRKVDIDEGKITLVVDNHCRICVSECLYSECYGKKEVTKKIVIELGDVALPYECTHNVVFNKSCL